MNDKEKAETHRQHFWSFQHITYKQQSNTKFWLSQILKPNFQQTFKMSQSYFFNKTKTRPSTIPSQIHSWLSQNFPSIQKFTFIIFYLSLFGCTEYNSRALPKNWIYEKSICTDQKSSDSQLVLFFMYQITLFTQISTFFWNILTIFL